MSTYEMYLIIRWRLCRTLVITVTVLYRYIRVLIRHEKVPSTTESPGQSRYYFSKRKAPIPVPLEILVLFLYRLSRCIRR